MGIIGLGYIAYRIDEGQKPAWKPSSHFGAYSKCPGTEVVAVAEINLDVLDAFKIKQPEVHMYQDYQEMLNKEELDIVSVCTPVATHCQIVRNVVRFDPIKVVFCEKPMASTINEAKQMIDSAEQFGVTLAVNFTRRWDETHLLIRKLLDSKEYGDLIKVIAYASRERDFEGNIHMLDLINYYCNNNSDFCYIDCPRDNYLIFELDLICSKGRITLKNNGRDLGLFLAKDSEYYSGLKELHDQPYLLPRQSWIGEQFQPFPTPMLNAVNNIVNFLEGKEQLKCTGHEGLKALELYEKVKSNGN